GLVDIQAADEIAAALFHLALRDDSDEFRRTFLEKYTVEQFLQNLGAAIKSIDPESQLTDIQPAESPTSAPPPAL
ncbi:MAG TPA: hypothetical protein VI282_08125, partial [Verrucomicrobiae bacterium]